MKTKEQIQNVALKKFKKRIMSKDLSSFKKDDEGYAVCEYKNGSVFKCRGAVVELAGLL
jgi:hypothetical protein